ncbi:MAG: GntR family transcriptional regulator [Clostridiales bacterium]|nr:GntR family transcriptional regulator [Clostridiales bacterium]
MKIIISNRSATPIYEQIKEQIKESIYSNELKEGEMLPSIRQLAKDLKISVITTTRAYNDLEQEGLISSVQGKGFFVEPKNHELIREKALCEIESSFATAIKVAKMALISKDELQIIFNTIAKEEEYE